MDRKCAWAVQLSQRGLRSVCMIPELRIRQCLRSPCSSKNNHRHVFKTLLLFAAQVPSAPLSVLAQVDRYTKTKKSIYTGFELFSLKERDIPMEVLELPNKSEKIIDFAWEPKVWGGLQTPP